MTESDIHNVMKKYGRKSKLMLMGFLGLVLFIHWFLIDQSISRRHELGLPPESFDSGFTIGMIVIGLIAVLKLSLYVIEKVLIDLLVKKNQE